MVLCLTFLVALSLTSKEFLEELVRVVFNPDRSLFRETSERKLYPSPISGVEPEVSACTLSQAAFEAL